MGFCGFATYVYQFHIKTLFCSLAKTAHASAFNQLILLNHLIYVYNKSTLSVRGAHKHKSSASRNREYMSLDCNAAYYLAFGGLIIRIENGERTRMGKMAKPLQNMNIVI